MRTARAFPRITAFRAQRVLRLSAFSIYPALVAGLIAGADLHSVGDGVFLGLAILATSLVMEPGQVPLRLMPLASPVVRAAVPVVGAAVALGALALAGSPVPVWHMIVPVVAAWIVTGFAAWVNLRFQMSRRVRVAMIGSPRLAAGLAHELRSANIRSHAVVGWLADDGAREEKDPGEPRWLGTLDQVRDIVEEHSIELLVHSSEIGADGRPRRSRLEVFEQIANECLDLPVRLLEASHLYEDLLGHVPLGQSNSAWFQYLLHPRYRAGSPVSKRIFDIVVAATMLIVLAPVLATLALVIKFTDRGPILYRQRRVGEGGREFDMIKLRSMRVESEGNGARWSTPDDDRITPVGKIIRRLHLDEMPQLWSVLRGEMTIVGPRPERPEMIGELERRLAYYDRRHLVKPGLAGWAQARCGYGGSEEGTGWKLCHDLYYLKHRSLYFDFLILLENVRVSLRSGVQFGLDAPQEQFILGNVGQLH